MGPTGRRRQHPGRTRRRQQWQRWRWLRERLRHSSRSDVSCSVSAWVAGVRGDRPARQGLHRCSCVLVSRLRYTRGRHTNSPRRATLSCFIAAADSVSSFGTVFLSPPMTHEVLWRRICFIGLALSPPTPCILLHGAYSKYLLHFP